MTTTSFLASLRLHADLPLVFRLGSARTLSLAPGYHLTEVKRVAYETMDCGAMTHRWSETQFELWVPPLVGALPGRAAMPAGKFLQIVDRVHGTLPLDGEAVVRVHAALGDHPAALYEIAAVTPLGGQLVVELTADRTRCKAAERRVGAVTGGCCGLGTPPDANDAETAGCGCGEKSPAGSEPVACCT